MQDGIIKGTGNSRYLKSISNFLQQYPTYQDFVAALVAGTLPIDLNGINETGWDQLGTALNKANLLSDETCAALGLPNTAVPDDAFNTLADTVFHGTIPKYTLLNSVVTDGSSQPVISLSGIDVSKRHYITVESPNIFNGYLMGLTDTDDTRELVRFSVQQTPYTYYSGNSARIEFNQLYSHIVELACSTDKSGDIPRRIRLFRYIVGQNNEIFDAYYCAPFNPGNGVPQLTFQRLPAGVTVKFWRKDTL